MMFGSAVIPPISDNRKELVEFRVVRDDDAPVGRRGRPYRRTVVPMASWGKVPVSRRARIGVAAVVGLLVALPLVGAWASTAVLGVPGASGGFGWGNNASGEVGDGTLVNQLAPVSMVGVDGVVSMAVGPTHGLLVRSSGAVSSWGHNRSGQLGDGGTTDRAAPGPVGGVSGVTRLAAGNAFSVTLDSGGAVWAWGNNASGQLGDGSAPTDHSAPVAVSGLGVGSGVVEIAAGASPALALKSDGSVWAWGNNASGQLGSGDAPTDHPVPVQVSGLGGVVAITAGDTFSLALKSDGSVLAWGNNASGQLGDGSAPADHSSPVAVGALGIGSGVARIVGGGTHSIALTADGRVYAWGNNASGQVGDGSAPADQHVPILIGGLSNIVDIAAGRAHSVAVASDGTVFSWGDNILGQLGDGTNTKRSVPGPVTGLGIGSKVVAVFASGDHSHALVGDGSVVSPLGAGPTPAATPVVAGPRTAG